MIPAKAEGASDVAMDLDLSHAVLVTPDNLSRQERKAVEMLLDEVEKRSLVRWEEAHAWPSDGVVVAVGSAAQVDVFAGPYAGALRADSATPAAEGFRLRVMENKAVLVVGNDARGVLFGIGRLLREMHMTRGAVRVLNSLDITTAPHYPLRGHQLGFRPKVNSYDGWTVPMWEQYYRDLAVFGTNAVELLPPRTDDAADSPHFPLPQIVMMAAMSQLADDYGLDVWVWYPAMGVDYAKRETVNAAIEEWADVLSKLPRVDAVFVPSGDPGHLAPKDLLDFLERAAETVRNVHPKAQLWVSMQGFNQERFDEFLGLLKSKQPSWLSGIVFGPQNRMPLAQLREALPTQYPIRHYPDITHGVQCQFPMGEWDPAYGFTEQREVINPRPMDFANIIRRYDEYTIGFLAYSEGCNDDVNKIVWSCLGWDPEMPVLDVLRQYARYFIGPDYEDTFAQGLLALERNWHGPLLTNRGVFTTLAQFQDMERNASPQLLLNWRFQQARYRAYYDAYTARRLAYETELEQQALDVLRQAPRLGTTVAMNEAERILDQAVMAPVAQDLRARVFELAEALYQSIRMQLSVPRYKAIHVDRGANLDLIDVPLNNRAWLKAQFTELRKSEDERAREQKAAEIVNWKNPGPGGFYDNLGSLTERPHLIREPAPEADPEFRQAPILGTEYDPRMRTSWCAYTETRYDSPLRLRYEGLDPQATYKVRVVYSGDNFSVKMRLVADDQFEIHPYIPKEVPLRPAEFDIPPEATAHGTLTLSWTQELGRGGSGRGCQVAEVWLIKKNEADTP
ncbi:MAG: hypothetical protein HY706_19245 [Candidatus Hydrogenedentes bacterium]|nr:hypothetical protein [Candidatus Hydrogenedentota bacterium]